eukprot:8174767-Pyramimonas_sp.AAC.1
MRCTATTRNANRCGVVKTNGHWCITLTAVQNHAEQCRGQLRTAIHDDAKSDNARTRSSMHCSAPQ